MTELAREHDQHSNPVLVEAVRSGFVESVHRGSVVITDPDGSVRFAIGEVAAPMFPRSSNKPFQALGMLHAGLEIGEADLAHACASHNGEPGHVARTIAMLERAGLDESALSCPPDFPLLESARHEVVRAGGDRRRAAMNCSGKHAAMAATCAQLDWPVAGYAESGHKLQQVIAGTVADLTGEPIAATGVDGCGAPLFAFSLTGLARAFGRLVTAEPGSDRRRIADAMRAHPWLVGGTGREDTLLMLAVEGLLIKGGAEAVHAMALPDGTAVALKVDDGGARARNPVLVAVLRALGVEAATPAAESTLDGLGSGAGEIVGAGGQVGELRVPAGLFDGLGAQPVG
ncbi:asparaginase [Amycolatopsis antarctica]|uniref:Asparaginase n=1 Tax=Amycolatopsis antarctica TaxID=1854586 RepID=A0A263D042_9PSEU|nr:asparaginase [Amycolatopsis antarctica]OZM71498.1 asparaginase [Amycolatopsis antarctica]